MSPLYPTEPLPPLTGCSTRVSLDSTPNAADPIGDYRPVHPTMPGYAVPVPRPDGSRAWLLDEDVTVAELPNGEFEVTAPDDITVRLDPGEVYRAANALGNLIVARLHHARQARAAVDAHDELEQALAAMLAPVAGQVLALMEVAA